MPRITVAEGPSNALGAEPEPAPEEEALAPEPEPEAPAMAAPPRTPPRRTAPE